MMFWLGFGIGVVVTLVVLTILLLGLYAIGSAR